MVKISIKLPSGYSSTIVSLNAFDRVALHSGPPGVIGNKNLSSAGFVDVDGSHGRLAEPVTFLNGPPQGTVSFVSYWHGSNFIGASAINVPSRFGWEGVFTVYPDHSGSVEPMKPYGSVEPLSRKFIGTNLAILYLAFIIIMVLFVFVL